MYSPKLGVFIRIRLLKCYKPVFETISFRSIIITSFLLKSNLTYSGIYKVI